jgi:hypothetical protein
VRQRRTKSSCAGAYPASVWVEWAQGPKWLVRAFARVGYPFVQPAAFIYGLIYRMPAVAFEGIVGNYILERDWHVHDFVMTPRIDLREPQSYVVEGMAPLAWGEKGSGAVTGPRVRLILPMTANEPIRFDLLGDFPGPGPGPGPGQTIHVYWNGVELDKLSGPGRLSATVPGSLTHHRGRLNELLFEGVPVGSTFTSLEFQSLSRWWP